jgi:hypothetical protein
MPHPKILLPLLLLILSCSATFLLPPTQQPKQSPLPPSPTTDTHALAQQESQIIAGLYTLAIQGQGQDQEVPAEPLTTEHQPPAPAVNSAAEGVPLPAVRTLWYNGKEYTTRQQVLALVKDFKPQD